MEPALKKLGQGVLSILVLKHKLNKTWLTKIINYEITMMVQRMKKINIDYKR